MLQFQEERMIVIAFVLTHLQRVIDETAAYCLDRHIFGKPIASHQAVRFRLAELQTELEALKALTHKAAALYCAGEDMTMLASMVKLKGGRLAREVTDACLQYWGGMGLTEEVLVARLYRDLRLMSIGGGADEVMLEILNKCQGLK